MAFLEESPSLFISAKSAKIVFSHLCPIYKLARAFGDVTERLGSGRGRRWLLSPMAFRLLSGAQNSLGVAVFADELDGGVLYGSKIALLTPKRDATPAAIAVLERVR